MEIVGVLFLLFLCFASFYIYGQLPSLIEEDFGPTYSANEIIYFVIMAIVILGISLAFAYFFGPKKYIKYKDENDYAGQVSSNEGLIETAMLGAVVTATAIFVADKLCQAVIGVGWLRNGFLKDVLVACVLALAPSIAFVSIFRLIFIDHTHDRKDSIKRKKQNSIRYTPQYAIIQKNLYAHLDQELNDFYIRSKAMTFKDEEISSRFSIEYYKYYDFDANYETVESPVIWENEVIQDTEDYIKKNNWGFSYTIYNSPCKVELHYKNPGYREKKVIK